MTVHACPHDGARPLTDLEAEQAGGPGYMNCRSRGYLCDACREDRADARVRWLVKALDALSDALADALLERP